MGQTIAENFGGTIPRGTSFLGEMSTPHNDQFANRRTALGN
jgi:hypothetical protein